MDYYLLSQVVAELSQNLTGARVERVFQGTDRDLYFLFRRGGKNFILLLSLQRSHPRMHLVSRKPQSATDPHPLVLNLRSRLVGLRLVHICLLNQDRIVEIAFRKETDSYCLILELTGQSSNLFFTDGELKILALYYPLTISQQASRLLLTGSHYVPPLKRTLDVPPRYGFDIDSSLSPNKSAENYYLNIVRLQKMEAVRSELLSLLRKMAKKKERKRSALITDLQDMEQAEDYRQKGDLVLAHLKQLKQGVGHADLMGYDGIPISVRLDPERSPSQNAELYFKKYKKAKKGSPLLRQRLAETEAELNRLRFMLTEIEKTVDFDSLNRLRSTLEETGPAIKGRGAGQQLPSDTVSGIKSILYSGWEILVGRNAAGNDRLTTKLARDEDLWLHAEGLPGSHVIVRNPHKVEIPPDIVVKAASLAAFYSKGKGAGKVPVAYTEARFVRKPKNAKPGLVTLSQRKTIMVRPAEDPHR
jgi:predicted ribosome quality control (RQC) complex YloA/Tae2 family protein